MQQRPARPAFTPLFQANSLNDYPLLASLSRKERRQYKKRRHKSSSKSHAAASSSAAMNYANAQVVKNKACNGGSKYLCQIL